VQEPILAIMNAIDKAHTWRWADVRDIMPIVAMAQQQFQTEIDSILTPDPAVYAYNIDKAITTQRHTLDQTQLLVCYQGEKLIAYTWISRGVYTDYSRDEIAEARFLHMDLDLSTRVRIQLCQEALDHWVKWCSSINIPVLVSTSIRRDQRAFLRLHERMGFDIRGSIAYKRIKEMKCEQQEQN